MIARFVVASLVLLVAGFCVADDKTDDKDRLQGEWVVVSVEFGGKMADGLKDKKLVVKGDEWTPPTGGEFTFTFTLDATKSPKQLDLVGDLGGKEQTWPGIYKI